PDTTTLFPVEIFFSTATGNIIEESEIKENIIETEDKKIVELEKIVNVSEEVAIEYYTEAPVAVEKNISKGKRVVVSGPDELNYTNVLAYSLIEQRVSLGDANKIKIYHYTEENNFSRELVNSVKHDLDSDGFVDYVEWVVPHLSDQTYDIIIEITRAEHLDSNRSFISDIYDAVKAQDGNWSEEIPAGDFVRVTFEKNLTSDRDITIYARSNSTSSINVYVENGEEIIASFENIENEELKKVYLTSLKGEEDVFDLEILGDSVYFDYIVDPSTVSISSSPIFDTNRTNYWNSGEFNQTNTTIDNQTLILTNQSAVAYYTLGNFTSAIFDLGSDQSFINVSWSEAIPYDDDLADNMVNEIATTSGGVDMTGNVLLLHLNNDSSNGENDTHVYDFSNNGNNGTGSGFDGDEVTTSGKFSGAFAFDGINDYTDHGNSNTLDLTGEISISTWIKFHQTATQTILGRGVTNDGDFFFGLSSDRFMAYIDGEQIYWGTAPTLSKEEWHHLMITAKTGANNVVVYQDGAQLFTGTSTKDIVGSSSYNLRVGKDDQFETYLFNGTVDEIAIWNRSLSAAEVVNIYKRGALKLNVSVRSCDDTECSGENWNETNNDNAGEDISDLTNNRYFQYKFYFRTDNANYTPELYNVSVNYQVSNTAPTLDAYTLAPTTAYTNTTLTGNITCTDSDGGDTITGYCQLYNNSNSHGSFVSETVTSGTNMNICNVTTDLTTKSESWKIQMWCGDGTVNTTKQDTSAVTILNLIPINPSPNLISIDGSNTTSVNLNCSSTITDVDSDKMNVTVRWYNNSVLDLEIEYNNSYTSGISFSALLSNKNLTSSDTWNCSIRLNDGNDSSSWVSSSNITILDITNPQVTINLPLAKNYSQLNVNITLNENGYCEYSLDSGLNNFTMTNNGNVDFNHTNLSIADGSYTLIAYCNDSFGNKNYTKTKGFAIDNTNPLVDYGVGTAVDGANLSQSNIYINISITELNEDSIVFLLWNSTSEVNSTTFTDRTRTINWTNLAYGNYTYNVTVNDSVGNLNTSLTRTITLDTTNPTVTLITPSNNTGDSDGNITFSYNVSDVGTISNCSLELNGVLNQTNSSITKASTQNFIINNLVEGNYNWSVNCTDSSLNIGQSERRIVSVALVSEFSGDTTDLSSVNMSNITNLIIHNSENGRINFSESVDLSGGGDLNTYVNISNNRIEINSTALAALDKSARLYFYNLTYTDPRPLQDGSVCSSCTEVSYSGNTFVYEVTGFSVYSSEETPSSSSSSSTSSEGGGSSGGGDGGAVIPKPKDVRFELNIESYETTIVLGKVEFSEIEILNKENSEKSFDIRVEIIDDIILFEEYSVNLPPRGIMKSEFKVLAPKEPGIYTGKIIVSSGNTKKEILTVINVKTEKSLFDITITIPKSMKTIKINENLDAQIDLLQMGIKEKMDVTLKYIIKDFSGNVILSESETIAVTDQKSLNSHL
ncbi:LamG-like jellyroll fold domain-containing protein, partial [Nanoarchaeota archaeon]